MRVELKTRGINDAIPTGLAAQGQGLPTDFHPTPEPISPPLEELVLNLTETRIETIDGKPRSIATATVTYNPADSGSRRVESMQFTFIAPLGRIEINELSWYLERYYLWPVGLFKDRAALVESKLPQWGEDLYKSALSSDSARKAVAAWQSVAHDVARCFSVVIDSALPEGSSENQQAAANKAASELLSLPWELLHDGRGYLFQGTRAVRVRRRLPNGRSHTVALTGLPIRILLVSPRPEDERATYIDHRVSARPLMEAIDSLGDLVKLTILLPPTFPALKAVLKETSEKGEPFDAVHFDGHGVFDSKYGLGLLCFEDPRDNDRLEQRASKLIDADKLAALMRDYRIPLVFLEACQTATQGEDPTASVASRLLDVGVASVVAMTHSVLVETSHRFVRTFYTELAQGRSTGAAMLAGQRELQSDTSRGNVMGAGDLRLQDWFVPVLYQEERDTSLITVLRPEEVKELEARQRQLRLGALPAEPKHKFQGRSRELLKLERLLVNDPYAVVRGQGGTGKTTLAVELARWLVRTGRYWRAAFVSLEEYTDARSVLDSLGQQLMPGDYSVAQFKDFKEALQPVEHALRDSPTIIVLDNFETLLSSAYASEPSALSEIREEILKLAQHLLIAGSDTRIVFTSREPLPAPFNHSRRDVQIGALARDDAIALVSEVMKLEGIEPKSEDVGGTPKEIEELVDAVNCQARALQLLARELAIQGVRTTTNTLHWLMAELDRRHPGDRHNSLYASLELSLRRLSPEMRQQAKALAVFHRGASLMVLHHVLQIAKDDTESVRRLGAALIDVGLAEDMGYGHFRLDAALPSYLLSQTGGNEVETLRTRWAEAMQALIGLLAQQRPKNPIPVARVTQLELANMMELLGWMEDKSLPESIVDVADSIERLVSPLDIKFAVTRAITIRAQAAEKLGGWSHARYISESANVENLLKAGSFQAAHIAAEQLLNRCLQAGPEAYSDMEYDLAMAYVKVGQVLAQMGSAAEALSFLLQARQRFEGLVDRGNVTSEQALTSVMLEIGDCRKALGQFDEAATMYESAIERSRKLDHRREVAVGKAQLGSLRLLQRRYDEALVAFEEARDIFESAGEENSVATAWHQIGRVHLASKRFAEAEDALRQALAVEVRTGLLSGEATTLSELGNLYNLWNRLDDAANFYRQSAAVSVKLQDLNREGMARHNLADCLRKVEKYDEARHELLRVIECRSQFGHAAQLWKTWEILSDVERALGNDLNATEARQKAIATYRAYRLAGGVNQSSGPLIEMVTRAIKEGDQKGTAQVLDHVAKQVLDERLRSLINTAQAILEGNRTIAIDKHPSLRPEDIAELQLLMEQNPAPNT